MKYGSDFILLDVVCLHIAFLLAYITRHGLENPYIEKLYRDIAIIYTMTDILLLTSGSAMKNVLKRGYYKEAVETVKHVFFVAVF